MGQLYARHGPLFGKKTGDGQEGATWASPQMPVSWGLMRPSGLTAVASTMTRPAPPTARLPRWTRCQMPTKPSWQEYWHIGETKMRLRMATDRRVMGENRMLMMPPM